MDSEHVKAILTADLIVWDELTCLLEKHPDKNLHAGSLLWTSRDVYAHFARWLNHSNVCIEAYCAGRDLPRLPAAPETMNDIWQQEDQRLSLAEARSKAGVALASRLAAIESIPDSKWDARLWELVNYDGSMHYAAHLNYIMEGKR